LALAKRFKINKIRFKETFEEEKEGLEPEG
jgi:hypothetical protein